MKRSDYSLKKVRASRRIPARQNLQQNQKEPREKKFLGKKDELQEWRDWSPKITRNRGCDFEYRLQGESECSKKKRGQGSTEFSTRTVLRKNS